jgi:tetratricopeptide (TPR) repeat protein
MHSPSGHQFQDQPVSGFRRTENDLVNGKAILFWRETLERNPDYLFAYQGLTAAYELSGNHEKALWAAADVIRINPKFSIEVEEKMSSVQDEAYKKRTFDALRSAGLK